MTSTPITAADIAKGKIDDALSVREKIGYGLGDAGGTVITCLIMNFLTFFYTDVFGLTPALVGTLFIALRVFDAISDPVMGVIADRTQSRWGALSSVAVVDCHSHRHYRHPDVHRARCQHGSKNRLGVRYLPAPFSRLYRHQRTVLRADQHHDHPPQ